MSRISLIASAISAAGLLVCGHAEAVQRSFVASFGSDANTAANCTFVNPCRSFTAAQTVTDPGGEIVALDAAGYGAITITKDISIIANPGFYAGISASTGNAVTIAAAGLDVVLRGLSINGIGAAVGINMTNGSSLIVDNCVISNFSSSGIIATSPGGMTLRVVNSVIRNNASVGIWVRDNTNADISSTKILNNGGVGIWVYPAVGGTPAFASISDTVVSGNVSGVMASGSAASKLTLIRSSVTNHTGSGVGAESGTVSVGYTLSSGNGAGFTNSGGTFESLGNNLVRQNTTDTSGTITVVGGT